MSKAAKAKRHKYIVVLSIESETVLLKSGLKTELPKMMGAMWPSIPTPKFRVRTVDLD